MQFLAGWRRLDFLRALVAVLAGMMAILVGTTPVRHLVGQETPPATSKPESNNPPNVPPKEGEEPTQQQDAPKQDQALQKSEESQRFEQSQVHMGTLFRIALYAPTEMAATICFQKAFDRIGKLDQIMSDYRDDSEITLLSRSAGGPPHPVGPELLDVLDRASEFSYLSGGSFDVTIGPVVRQWRRARRLRKMPTDEQLATALARVGQDKIRVDRGAKAVELTTPGMLLDLGGIGKGYACDEVIELLQEMGISSALVDAGGNVAVSGPPPQKDGWTVELAWPKDKPDEKVPPLPERFRLQLVDQAIATSGDTEQFVELGGVHYSHIVDPKTGIGLTRRVQVTVLASDATTADALSTALSVMPIDEGKKLITKLDGVAAAYVVREGDQLHVTFTEGWPNSRMSASSNDSGLQESARTAARPVEKSAR